MNTETPSDNLSGKLKFYRNVACICIDCITLLLPCSLFTDTSAAAFIWCYKLHRFSLKVRETNFVTKVAVKC